MTSASNYTFVPDQTQQAPGLTAHRHTQLPSYAMQTGASSMPPAWQTRNAPYYDGQRHDAPVRSFSDIALDPWRKMTATLPRKIAFGVVLTGLALTVLF